MGRVDCRRTEGGVRQCAGGEAVLLGGWNIIITAVPARSQAAPPLLQQSTVPT